MKPFITLPDLLDQRTDLQARLEAAELLLERCVPYVHESQFADGLAAEVTAFLERKPVEVAS